MHGSLALVGSGEYLPAMAEFEKSLLDDGIKNGKEISISKYQQQRLKRVPLALSIGEI